MTLITPAIRDQLSGLYSAEKRFYHTLAHVDALLALLEKHRPAFHDPEAVEAAIWFHDAIYDSRAKDNEAKSAELAEQHLGDAVKSGLLSPDRLARICEIIRATANHMVPQFEDPRAIADAEKFLDMDLSILGADKEEFDQYEAAVRREFEWASDQDWKKGRAGFIRSFLARENGIFYSGVFREALESKARQNLTDSLKNLQ